MLQIPVGTRPARSDRANAQTPSTDRPWPPSPPGRSGRGPSRASVLGAGGRPRPDQPVVLPVLALDEVGEERGGKARIVELEPEVVAALLRGLGPGSPDLGLACEDAVVGALSLGRLSTGTMRTFLACMVRVMIGLRTRRRSS